MPHKVTVRTPRSWFSRLSESIKSVVVGIGLFAAAVPVLFWNEGRAVETARSLEEGSGVVVSVSPDRVDPANQMRLVHVSAFAKTDEVLEDETFGISENALHLIREVEMYQWVEEKRTTTEKGADGDERVTTYEYSRKWEDELVDSDRFHGTSGHENPRAFPYERRQQTAGTVSLGAFTLSESQVQILSRSEPLAVTALPDVLKRKAKFHDGSVYFGADPGSPAVGDVRVSFRIVRPHAVSVVAPQNGSSFEPYQAKAGGTVFLLEESIASAETMFATAQRNNALLAWLLRAAGFFMMFIGLALVFRPLAVAGDVVPLLGGLLRAGVFAASGLIAAVSALVVIGIGWLAYRPSLSAALFALGIAAVVLLLRKSRAKAGATLPPLPPPAATETRSG